MIKSNFAVLKFLAKLGLRLLSCDFLDLAYIVKCIALFWTESIEVRCDCKITVLELLVAELKLLYITQMINMPVQVILKLPLVDLIERILTEILHFLVGLLLHLCIYFLDHLTFSLIVILGDIKSILGRVELVSLYCERVMLV